MKKEKKSSQKLGESSRKESTTEEYSPSTSEKMCMMEDEKLMVEIDKRMPFQLTNFIPNPDMPLKFVCVNLHIFQNADETKNYSKKHIGDFRQVFEWLNEIYRNQFRIPNYLHPCSSKPVLQQQFDSRIRFIFNRIEFYQDDALCNLGINNYTPLVNAMLLRDSSMDSQLNIFLTSPKTTQPAGGYANGLPSTNLNFKQYIHSFVKPPYINVGYWWAQHFAHEIGHVLGLHHTYSGAICNETDPLYLYDIHGCSPNQTCPFPGQTTNNLMDGAESWSISTLQTAVMQYSIQNLSVKQYAENICCPKCVAFGAKIDRHKSQGDEVTLQYYDILANESSAFDGKLFTCPVDGIYNFSVSFQKDSLVDNGTYKEVWIHLMANWGIIGTVMSEKADAKTDFSPGNAQFGRRDTVSISINIKLKKSSVVKTIVKSDNGDLRNIVDVNFSGHLLCPCCC